MLQTASHAIKGHDRVAIILEMLLIRSCFSVSSRLFSLISQVSGEAEPGWGID